MKPKDIKKRVQTVMTHEISSLELRIERRNVKEITNARPRFKVGDRVYVQRTLYDPCKEKSISCPGCRSSESFYFKDLSIEGTTVASIEIHVGPYLWGFYYRLDGSREVATGEQQIFASPREAKAALLPAIERENKKEMERYEKRLKQVRNMKEAERLYRGQERGHHA